jgi:K+-transporting ATPase KdpF subunit
MNAMYVVSAIIAAALMIYLFFALLQPERFE